MASEPLKNVGVSVRDRLLNRSREERIDFQLLLTRYALERLLYRLSRSEHRNRFILKGAMLFATWVDTPFRPTRDLDLLGYGEGSPEAIGQCFRAICNQPVDNDGVVFDVDGLEAGLIREDSEYGGVRIRTQATIAGARIPIQSMWALVMPSRQVLSKSTIPCCSMLRHRSCARIRSRR